MCIGTINKYIYIYVENIICRIAFIQFKVDTKSRISKQ